MGRALKPGRKVLVYLEYDKNEPIETRPTFYGRSFNADEQVEYEEAYIAFRDRWKEQENEPATPREALEESIDMVARFIVDWKNQIDPDTGEEIPFSRDAFKRVLADDEVYELINVGRFYSNPTPDEKKSSESQP